MPLPLHADLRADVAAPPNADLRVPAPSPREHEAMP
jgi:hypothetical protein